VENDTEVGLIPADIKEMTDSLVFSHSAIKPLSGVMTMGVVPGIPLNKNLHSESARQPFNNSGFIEMLPKISARWRLIIYHFRGLNGYYNRQGKGQNANGKMKTKREDPKEKGWLSTMRIDWS